MDSRKGFNSEIAECHEAPIQVKALVERLKPREYTEKSFLDSRFGLLLKKLGVGTVANLVSTFITLPFFWAAVQMQLPGKRKYSDVVNFAMTKEGVGSIYKASKDALKFAPKQSISYLGVYNLFYDSFKGLGAYQCGLVLGSLTAVTESLATKGDLQSIIRKWSENKAHIAIDEKIVKRRSLVALLLKNGIANPATIVSVLATREYLEENMSAKSSYSSVLSGLIGGAVANLTIIPPANTVLTRALHNPEKTFVAHARDIYQTESVGTFWKGAGARTAQKAIQAGIGFGVMEVGNDLIHRYMRKSATLE